MSQPLTIHAFGDSGPEVGGSPSRSPGNPDFNQIIASADGPIAFVKAGLVGPDDLAGAATVDADATLVIADASAASGGRGSTDLCAVLWQSFPAVAVLLGNSLLDAGGIVFSEAGLQRLPRPFTAPGNPLESAIAAIVEQGGTVRAVLVPAGSEPVLPVDPPQLLPAGPPADRNWLRDLIHHADARRWLGDVTSGADLAAVKAGLLLWHDFLDESHQFSQSIEGKGRNRAGDYWHAIMHRREGDFGNSKYWFRRVGSHPVFESLAARRGRLSAESGDDGPLLERIAPGGIWDPCAFVDACQQCSRSGDAATDLLLRRLQADEMLLLLWQTCVDVG